MPIKKYSLLIGASLLVLSACGQNKSQQETTTTATTTTTQETTEASVTTLVEQKLPNFSIVDNTDATKTEADFAGKPTLYVAWASWCPDCQQQLPILNELRQEYADKVQFVFVNLLVRGETEEKAHAYMTEKNYTFDYYADKMTEFQSNMHLQSIPTMILVDSDGTVKTVFDEVQTKDTLQTALDTLK